MAIQPSGTLLAFCTIQFIWNTSRELREYLTWKCSNRKVAFWQVCTRLNVRQEPAEAYRRLLRTRRLVSRYEPDKHTEKRFYAAWADSRSWCTASTVYFPPAGVQLGVTQPRTRERYEIPIIECFRFLRVWRSLGTTPCWIPQATTALTRSLPLCASSALLWIVDLIYTYEI